MLSTPALSCQLAMPPRAVSRALRRPPLPYLARRRPVRVLLAALLERFRFPRRQVGSRPMR